MLGMIGILAGIFVWIFLTWKGGAAAMHTMAGLPPCR